jgi:hypothetical protein
LLAINSVVRTTKSSATKGLWTVLILVFH